MHSDLNMFYLIQRLDQEVLEAYQKLVFLFEYERNQLYSLIKPF